MDTVCSVHFRNLPGVATLFDDIIVKLIPKRQCSELRSRKLGERTEVKTVDDKSDTVRDKSQ